MRGSLDLSVWLEQLTRCNAPFPVADRYPVKTWLTHKNRRKCHSKKNPDISINASCQDPPQDQRPAGWGHHQGYWDDVERVIFSQSAYVGKTHKWHKCIYRHWMLSVTILGDLFLFRLCFLLCLKGFLFSITRGLVSRSCADQVPATVQLGVEVKRVTLDYGKRMEATTEWH